MVMLIPAQRKAASDNSSMQETIYKQKAQLDSTEKALKDAQNALRSAERELERCKQEGDGMREEVSLVRYSLSEN